MACELLLPSTVSLCVRLCMAQTRAQQLAYIHYSLSAAIARSVYASSCWAWKEVQATSSQSALGSVCSLSRAVCTTIYAGGLVYSAVECKRCMAVRRPTDRLTDTLQWLPAPRPDELHQRRDHSPACYWLPTPLLLPTASSFNRTRTVQLTGRNEIVTKCKT